MQKLYVGTKSNRELQLIQALDFAKPGDTIVLMPGNYFTPSEPNIFEIEKDVTIVGKTYDCDDVKIFGSFFIKKGASLTIENLTVNYTRDKFNTVMMYDNDHFTAKNVHIKHSVDDNWNPIYAQNSTLSLTNSTISSCNNETQCLSVENCQLYLANNWMDAIYLKSSQCLIKDTTVNVSVTLDYVSTLDFVNLHVNAFNSLDRDEFYVFDDSRVTGKNLYFSSKKPQICVCQSSFTNNIFNDGLENITWYFDEQSNVKADDVTPFTNGLD